MSRRQKYHIPLGWVPLLLDLREDAFGLVVDAVRAGGELAVALDLFLPAHVTGLAGRSASASLVPTKRGKLQCPDSPSRSSSSLLPGNRRAGRDPQTFGQRRDRARVDASAFHVRRSHRRSVGVGSSAAAPSWASESRRACGPSCCEGGRKRRPALSWESGGEG